MSLTVVNQAVVHAGVNRVVGKPAASFSEPSLAALRQHIARELHDSVGQSLTLMLIELEQFKADQVGRQSVLGTAQLLQDSMRATLNDVRALLYELRGDDVEQLDFAAATAQLLAGFESATGIAISAHRDPVWPEFLPPITALHLYRIIGEALNNVRLHSGADYVRVSLGGRDGQLEVVIHDNGRGLQAITGCGHGMGLVGMRERAMLLAGTVEVSSAGTGTTVRILIPLAEGG